MRTFINALLSGETTPSEMWEWEAAWQDSYTHVPLHAWLGLSEEELAAVRGNSGALEYVLEARRAGVETSFPKKTDDSFVSRLVDGTSTIDDYDDALEEWHNSNSSLPLHTFLGLSWDEYKVVATEPPALKYVVEARKTGIGSSFPEIIGCACGKDHDTMPKDVEFDDNGKEWEYELVCRKHKRHEPCRRCLYGN